MTTLVLFKIVQPRRVKLWTPELCGHCQRAYRTLNVVRQVVMVNVRRPMTKSHVPGKHVKLYFGVCLWRCFRKILALESLYWGKQSPLPSAASLVAGWKKKKICLPTQKTRVRTLGWEDPLEEEMATHSSILVSDSFCDSMNCSPQGYSVYSSREWLPTPGFLPGEFHGQRTLAGYSPLGSQRVGHDSGTNTHAKASLCKFFCAHGFSALCVNAK